VAQWLELLQTVLGFLVVLLVLVGVHEFGHFYVARRCGVRVLRFSIGMGKPFFSWYDKQGTEFALAPIPLGGYVKMLDESDASVSASEKHFAYNNKTPWQRIAILAAGPLANLILAVVVFALLGFKGIASYSPVVGEVEPGSLAERAGVAPGQEILEVDGEPTATREAVMERLIYRLGESGELRLTVKDEQGQVQTLSLGLNAWLKSTEAPDPFAGLGFEFVRPTLLPVVHKLLPGSAAEKAGMLPGDRLTHLDGHLLSDWQQWVEAIQQRPGQSMNVRLERNGQEINLNLTPDSESLDGRLIGRIGVYPEFEPLPESMRRFQELGPVEAVQYGFSQSLNNVRMVLVSIEKLVVGEISTKNLSGPIGIAKVAGDSARAGLFYYLGFLAQLSVYLAVLNLLPIPVLDGGHIVYCLVEAAKGSPVSEKFKLISAQLGLVLLGGLMIVAFYNDILRL
jgi:regulator of sigma E protease